jgi:trans-2,3-dihydro-3-hydroxyanthranilate isomerase
MPTFHYAIYDVFTEKPLTGNPLAVVFEADTLEDDVMQAIAREFNLSETVFLCQPQEPAHTAALRIFTPAHEMPFAGHPTIGTAIALHERSLGNGAGGASLLVLEEKIGLVRCAVSAGDESKPFFAEFALPKLPEPLPFAAEPSAFAAALGLDPQDVGFENHRIGLWSAGVPYVLLPVHDLAAAARVRLDKGLWKALATEGGTDCFNMSAYVYCRETRFHDSDFHARMFVTGEPSYEDPATGSAAAAFAGALVQHDQPVDGQHSYWIEQGIEMGRPSRIRLSIDCEAGQIASARIGGYAVQVAEGWLAI